MKFKALYLFAGIGGGALGFQQAREEWKGTVGQIETICGIDADPEACEDFENITGAQAVQMDLFSRQQYIDFHGEEPPEDWKEILPHDIWEATKGEHPDIIFTSPPCKGFSGLLPQKSAKTRKYQALNQLTVRGIELCLKAFEDDLPALFLLENVPRITTRGEGLLNQIKNLLQKHGYAVSDGFHDCGEIGGLAQHRKRYLLIARNEKKMPSFIYKPPQKDVKTIGDVIGPLPMPDDPAGGPMHRLPRLQWKTWVRLALIPAGGDWRDLETCEWEKYRIQYVPRKGAMKVEDWNESCGAVTGAAWYGRINGTQAVSDTRLPERENRHQGVYRIVNWQETGPCVTGTRFGSGAPAIADPRTGFKDGTHHAIYRVQDWNEAGKTITGAMRPNNGAGCIADPRLSCSPRSGTMGVQKWDEPAKTIIGAGDIHAGAAAVADPRIPEDTEQGVWVIIAPDGTWHRPLTTYELAILQGFPDRLSDGRPFQLAGNSDARWRERIGNAVPPAAAQAIAETMLRALMPSQEGLWVMSSEEIWVLPEEKKDEEQLTN